jgi:hypothetical protein
MTTPDQSEDSNVKLLADIWGDIQRQFEAAAGLADELVDSFLVFLSSTPVDLKTLLGKITTAIIDIAIDTLENMADIIIKVVSLALGAIRTLGDSVIQCPIFSNIWETITDGRQLTLFNFCGLLAAIPATLVFKTVLGKAPPSAFQGRLTKGTFSEFVQTGKVAADETLSIDLVLVSTTALVGARTLLTGVEAISLLADFAFDGSGLEMVKASSFKAVVPGEPEPKWTIQDVIFDSVAFAFSALKCVFTLPLWYSDPDDYMIHRVRWGAWIMDAFNTLAILAAWAAGAFAGVSHIITKRARACLMGATLLPTFGMKLGVVVHEISVNKKLDVFTRHALSIILDVISDNGFIAAAWADKREGPEAVAIKVAGYAVFFTGAVGAVALIIPDVAERGKEILQEFEK